ncbi:hypothetical protein [Vibrio europaeus]|uniref:hypothetical protein n=1 Tax=Vibrio europaeus TaxID=300876 RepID=UPI00233F12F4|nr:hypothetical protein [Vibrio europaeus]MDC5753606.1 hypothetical protein [Vibrio europaeus]MDC5816481.1 hypothetical protein [Vibrio europaeus]
MKIQSKAFVQTIKVNGQEIDKTVLVSCAYIESLDLSSPCIITSFKDDRGDLRDDLKLGEGAIIDLEFGDVDGRGRAMFQESFVISDAPIRNNVIHAEGFSKAINALKQPAVKPKFLVDKPVETILATLCEGTGLAIQCSVSGVGTYHLNYDMTPSRLIRNIARDFGAAVWVSRGVLYFRPYEELMSQAPAYKVGLNAKDVDIDITKHEVVKNQKQFERVAQKNFFSWSIDKGMQASVTNADKSKVLVTTNQSQLNNLSKYAQPLLVLECYGISDLQPSNMLDFILVRLSNDESLDESLPNRMFITRITHYTQGERYLINAEVGVSNE